jgi:hypothetical protein
MLTASLRKGIAVNALRRAEGQMNIEQNLFFPAQTGIDALQQILPFLAAGHDESLGDGEIREALGILRQPIEEIRPYAVETGSFLHGLPRHFLDQSGIRRPEGLCG